MQENSLIKNLNLISKFMISHTVFGHAGKQLDTKSKFNFKISDLTRWITNNSDAKIYQFLKK